MELKAHVTPSDRPDVVTLTLTIAVPRDLLTPLLREAAQPSKPRVVIRLSPGTRERKTYDACTRCGWRFPNPSQASRCTGRTACTYRLEAGDPSIRLRGKNAAHELRKLRSRNRRAQR